MGPAGRAISPWESRQNLSTPGGSSCKATASPSRKKLSGRKAASPFTFVTPPGTRWNWSRRGCGGCRVGGERGRMLSLRKPSAERLWEFMAAKAKLNFTYAAVGATAAVPPAGYVVDRTRIKLGEGAGTFAAAKAALRRWEHFRLGWVETWPPDAPIQAGQVVGVIARLFGLWWLNACRIVYAVDEAGPVQRFGFAY